MHGRIRAFIVAPLVFGCAVSAYPSVGYSTESASFFDPRTERIMEISRRPEGLIISEGDVTDFAVSCSSEEFTICFIGLMPIIIPRATGKYELLIQNDVYDVTANFYEPDVNCEEDSIAIITIFDRGNDNYYTINLRAERGIVSVVRVLLSYEHPVIDSTYYLESGSILSSALCSG